MKIKFLFFILLFFRTLFPQINPDTLIISPALGDSLKQDSSARRSALLDSIKVSKRDSLAPLYQTPFYQGSYFISNKRMMFADYRYAADFMELFPFTFIFDKGFIGQPSEVLIYGTGFNSISYFQDGVLINDRYSNSLDLNNIQSESVDSIEIVPAPRGFLYGPFNNTVSVNFLTKDLTPKLPYSRIKYYEGPSGEAMFDGIFSAMLFKKLNFYTDITNRKTDERFTNSSFSIWQAGAKLKYFFSKKINLSAGYNFIHSETGINGGVDVDSIRRITSNVDSLLYNETFAPVVQPNAFQKIKQHHFGLRMQWNPEENLNTDLNLYYKFYLDELTGLRNYRPGNSWIFENQFNSNSKNKIWGGVLKQNYSSVSRIGIFNAQLNLNYEYQDNVLEDRRQYDSLSIPYKNSYYETNFSISPIFSILSLDSNFVISFFYKYNRTFDDLHGAGLDLFYRFKSNTFYFGYSEFQLNYIDVVKTLEAGIKLLYFNSLFDFRILKRKAGVIFPRGFGIPERIDLNSSTDTWAFGFNCDVRIWKLGLECQSFYNLKDSERENEFQFRGGIFYKNVLFDSSLNLKTGFNVYYFGKHYLLLNNFETFSVNPSSRIDFTLAGEIQKSAIAYFAWENLLGENYYIVPYYPMPGRSIRFGIAWEIFN